MPTIDNILFPVDFSERNAAAAESVDAMVREFDARLTLVHAINPADYVLVLEETGEYQLASLYKAYKERTDTKLQTYMRERFPDARRVLLEGEPGSAITAWAHANATDLIMMPTRGVGPFRSMLLGSVTSKVLHDAERPVWTGAHLDDPPNRGGRVHRVMCAVDLGPLSEITLRWAGEFARSWGAKLDVAHVVPTSEGRPAKYFDAELVAVLAGEAREQIGSMLAHARLPQSAIHVRGGTSVASVVHNIARDLAADVVLISRGAANQPLGRLRSNAYSIIRASPCPVISV